RIHSLGPAFVCPRVHGGLFIKMRWRIHPNEIEVFGTVGACPDGQGIFEVRRVHPVTQRGPLARGWEMIKLPSLVAEGYDHVRLESDLQPLRHDCRGHEVIMTFQRGPGLTGDRSLRALEAPVLVVQMGAGEGERPPLARNRRSSSKARSFC